MQATRTPLRLLFAAAMLTFGVTATADSQGMLDRMKKRAEEAAKRKIEDKAVKTSDDITDAAMNRVECTVRDSACIEKAKADGKQVDVRDASGAPVAGGATVAMTPGEGVWANYDFVPGERILFADDFTKDNVGDFPRRLELGTGNMEIVEWQGRRFLLSTTEYEFTIPLPETLPERFTVEFDLRYTNRLHNNVDLRFGAPDSADHVQCGPVSGIMHNRDFTKSAKTIDETNTRTLIRCRAMVDGKYAKVYVNDMRTGNHPNTNLGRAKSIKVSAWNGAGDTIMIGDIRVAAGGRKLYDALSTKGRVATQGIYFDTGSDRIRPESTPTLKEIGDMLKDHADLKLTIEGHTDNVGSAASNRELSAKRAAAVKAFLVDTYGIDAARLASVGLGDTKPSAPNATAEGRQQNRRVELVK